MPVLTPTPFPGPGASPGSGVGPVTSSRTGRADPDRPPSACFSLQMEFDEKELRKEISYAIKNIHGIRHVLGLGKGRAEPGKQGQGALQSFPPQLSGSQSTTGSTWAPTLLGPLCCPWEQGLGWATPHGAGAHPLPHSLRGESQAAVWISFSYCGCSFSTCHRPSTQNHHGPPILTARPRQEKEDWAVECSLRT